MIWGEQAAAFRPRGRGDFHEDPWLFLGPRRAYSQTARGLSKRPLCVRLGCQMSVPMRSEERTLPYARGVIDGA